MKASAKEECSIAASSYRERIMPDLLKSIPSRKNPEEIAYAFSILAMCHESYAAYDYVVKNDITAFKQNLHVSTMLKLDSIRLNDHERFSIGSEIVWALLSDNPVLIDRVAGLEPKWFVEERGKPLYRPYWVHMIQLAILGDYEQLQAKVTHWAKNARKEDRAFASDGKDFFSLLMRADKVGLESAIKRDIRPKVDGAIAHNFLAWTAAMQAKICWLKGIPVEIDDAYLPMELMPIQPLARYDDVYDFLAPGYVPPEVSLWNRFSFWYTNRKRQRAELKP